MKWNISGSDKVFTSEYLEGVKAVTFNKENYKYNINLHRVWAEAFSCASPIFFRKKIPQSTFPPCLLWLQALASCSSTPPFFTLCWWESQLGALQTPALLMNKHHSICGAKYISETMSSFKVCRIAWSSFVNDPSGTALSGWGANSGASLTSPSTRSSVSSCTNSTGNGFFFPSCYFLSIKIMQTQQIQQLLLLSLWNV